MVPVPCAHARLAPHDVCDVLELLGVDVSVSVQVEHLEGDLEVAPRRRQNRQQEHVVAERYQTTYQQQCKIKTVFNYEILHAQIKSTSNVP